MVFSSIVDFLKCAKLKLVAGGSGQNKPVHYDILENGNECGAPFEKLEYLLRHQRYTVKHRTGTAKRE